MYILMLSFKWTGGSGDGYGVRTIKNIHTHTQKQTFGYCSNLITTMWRTIEAQQNLLWAPNRNVDQIYFVKSIHTHITMSGSQNTTFLLGAAQWMMKWIRFHSIYFFRRDL